MFNRFLVLMVFCSTCFAQAGKPPMTNKDLLAMIQSGASDEVIISAIKAGPTNFTMSPDGVRELSNAGMSANVTREFISSYTKTEMQPFVIRGNTPETVHGDRPAEKLSDDELKAAVGGANKDRWVNIEDMGLMAAQGAQTPSITIMRSDAALAIRNESAKKQFRNYEIGPDDRDAVIVVYAKGYVGKTYGCEDITRVVLLSDPSGSVVKEAYSSEPTSEEWGNAYGSRTLCQNLRARFSLDSVRAARNAAKDGEFYVATFAGATMTKMYKVKHKHQAKLDLDSFLSRSQTAKN